MRDGTYLNPPDSLVVDSLQPWEERCIDCFIRIESVKEDKKECEKDLHEIKLSNDSLHKDNTILKEENKVLKKKRPINFINGFFTGVTVTAVTLFILLL